MLFNNFIFRISKHRLFDGANVKKKYKGWTRVGGVVATDPPWLPCFISLDLLLVNNE